MTPDKFCAEVIDPGLARLFGLAGLPPPSQPARSMMLAIALQESGAALAARYQGSPAANPGPARGFWQFEQGGGVYGVLNHPASRSSALRLCEACEVVSQTAAVWRALEGHDFLACGFARLLLWTDPAALPPPTPASREAAWNYYLRLWRPGKPHPETWAAHWATATGAAAV